MVLHFCSNALTYVITEVTKRYQQLSPDSLLGHNLKSRKIIQPRFITLSRNCKSSKIRVNKNYKNVSCREKFHFLKSEFLSFNLFVYLLIS